MDKIDPRRVSDALKSAPIWARLALTASSESLVERAADQMAALIVHRLEQPEPPVSDARQMVLPIA